MTKLPRDAEVRRVLHALLRLGFEVVHIAGGHYKLVHSSDPSRVVTVPFHGELPVGILRSILRTARISLEEFLEVFEIL